MEIEPMVDAPPPEPPRSARWIQQTFLENLGDRTWDEYTDNKFLIKQKIAYAIFGPPSEDSDLDNLDDNSNFGYNGDQLETIIPLYKKILEFCKYSPNKQSIFMSVIFVCIVPQVPKIANIHLMDNLEFSTVPIVPVFRIRKCIKTDVSDGRLGCSFFIDHTGRVYKSWEGFLNNNKLEKGIVICPENGRYSGFMIGDDIHVKLHIQLSPASTVKAKVKNAVEVASTVVAVGAAGVVATSIFWPVGVAVGTATVVASVITGAFGIGSSTHQLHDRKTHCEDISLGDAQARGAWINIAASSTGMIAGASSKLISKAAGSGVVIGKGFQVAHNTANIASLVMSGTGIFNSLVNFHIQYKKSKRLPSNLELFQFASSILFFTNSLVSNKMAKTIIEESQATTINSYRESLSSNRLRKMFDKMSGETRRLHGPIEGNAEIIRSTTVIGNQNDFFRNALRINKDLNENGVRISFKDGQALFNGEHLVSPQEFYTMNLEERSIYLSSIGKANLSVTNASTRLTTPAQFSGGSTITVGTALTSIIKISRLMDSFPEIAGNDEVLLQFIANKITTFVNDSTMYDNFVDVINWLHSHLDDNCKEMLVVLDIDGTNLLYKLFQACYEFLLNVIGDESGIPDTLRLYFRNGKLQEDRVMRILIYFKSKLIIDYEEISRNELRCCVCGGVTFSKD